MAGDKDIVSNPELNCNGSSPSAGCNTMAKGEQSNGYTAYNKKTGAAGRYQFIPKTAKWILTSMLGVSASQADELWNKCKTSDTPECKSLQDQMCNKYYEYTIKQIQRVGVLPLDARSVWFAWNQGVNGASHIYKKAHEPNPEDRVVTNKTILRNMKGQAFNGDNERADIFIQKMHAYLDSGGYPR